MMGLTKSWKMNPRVATLFASTFLAMMLGTVAVHGGMVELGNCGWQAVWDDSFDEPVALVDIVVDACLPGEDIVFIQKAAQFTQGPGGPDLLIPTIPIAFNQTSADAVGTIAINDEIITNSTGAD